MTEPQTPSTDLNALTKDECTWGMLCHISTFAGCVFPFGNLLAPLIIWLIKKDELPFVDDQGKEALNFQISLIIYFFVSGLLCIILIGIPILIGLIIFDIWVTIIAAIKANEGFKYRYPLAIRFIS